MEPLLKLPSQSFIQSSKRDLDKRALHTKTSIPCVSNRWLTRGFIRPHTSRTPEAIVKIKTTSAFFNVKYISQRLGFPLVILPSSLLPTKTLSPIGSFLKGNDKSLIFITVILFAQVGNSCIGNPNTVAHFTLLSVGGPRI